MSAEVIQLYDANFRDPVAVLRRIADAIEDGDYGAVATVGVVVLGDRMEVFGGGMDAEDASIALLLHSGFLRMSKAIEEHGR